MEWQKILDNEPLPGFYATLNGLFEYIFCLVCISLPNMHRFPITFQDLYIVFHTIWMSHTLSSYVGLLSSQRFTKCCMSNSRPIRWRPVGFCSNGNSCILTEACIVCGYSCWFRHLRVLLFASDLSVLLPFSTFIFRHQTCDAWKLNIVMREFEIQMRRIRYDRIWPRKKRSWIGDICRLDHVRVRLKDVKRTEGVKSIRRVRERERAFKSSCSLIFYVSSSSV